MFNDYLIKTQRLCKVCDSWVETDYLQDHLDHHAAVWEAIQIERKAEAEYKRKEALRLKRENAGS